MTRAEEKALEAYPVKMVSGPIGYEEPKFDINGLGRTIFIEGYEQAEKDLALTPDDIKLITKIHYEIVFKDTTGIKVGNVASEVLKRYKEAKK